MPQEDDDDNRYRGYALAEESLLLGGISPTPSDFNDLESLSELFTTTHPTLVDPSVTALVTATQPVINIAHKRQILEAIPRIKRPNSPQRAPPAAPRQAIKQPQDQSQAQPQDQPQE